jgi:hypothetical protein
LGEPIRIGLSLHLHVCINAGTATLHSISRQSEIEYLHLPPVGLKNVGGLNVPVNDALACDSSASPIWIVTVNNLSVPIGWLPIICDRVCPPNRSIIKAPPLVLVDCMNRAILMKFALKLPSPLAEIAQRLRLVPFLKKS